MVCPEAAAESLSVHSPLEKFPETKEENVWITM